MEEVQNIFDQNKEALVIPDGIAVIGTDQKIIVFNEAASRITGFSEDQIVSQHCSILFGNNTSCLSYFKESVENKRSYSNLPIAIVSRDGKNKNVLASISPIIKGEQIVSVVFVFRDTFEMLSMSESLQDKTRELIDEKNKLDAIFNSNIEGTFTIDHEWNITSFNTSAERLTGYAKKEAIGKKCWEIFNSALCRNGCHMEKTMTKGKSEVGNELEIISREGNRIPIRVNSAVLKNDKNENIGGVETFIDLSEIRNLTAHLDEVYSYENIIGKNKNLKKVIDVLESVSQTSSSVLITGESGTGKELAARAIHLKSANSTKPFTAINCSAFAETLIESELFGHEKGAFTGAIKSKPGRFELAQDGTLFLDEIGDLSLKVQTKLLRVIETREYERVGGHKTMKLRARIIAATNKNLSDEIKSGNFREDLYYRINIINIHLPPLRERKDDLPLLVNHFINNFNQRFNKDIRQFSSSAYNKLLEYDWPGNIRELENVVEHAFILCPNKIIQTEHIPSRIKILAEDSGYKSDSDHSSNLQEAEKEIIVSKLKKHYGSRKKTAEELGINTSTLWRKMKKLGIDRL